MLLNQFADISKHDDKLIFLFIRKSIRVKYFHIINMLIKHNIYHSKKISILKDSIHSNWLYKRVPIKSTIINKL